MDRHMESPSPSPFGLVLTKGLNASSIISLVSPEPLSVTMTSPHLPFLRTDTSMPRSAGGK